MRSMTGFGRGQAAALGLLVEVELRTLNGRFLEVRVKGLSEYPGLLFRAEEKLRSAFHRGSVEATVRLTPLPGTSEKSVDLELARKYLADLRALQEELGLEEKPGLSHLLALGVFQEKRRDEEVLWAALESALSQAIEEAQASRAREGQALRDALLSECGEMKELLEKAEELAQEDQKIAEERLRKRLSDIAFLDPARVNTEISAFLARCDVREELDRLRAHTKRFWELLSEEGPVGKELEFLAQEMAREAGTLAAKAYGPELAELALRLRLGAERLREQVRNVE